MNPPVVLTIAGTDPGGGAGIAADLATFAALGVHGACAVTAVTAQDTTRVRMVHPLPVDVIEAQLDAVFDDLPVAAVKTGLLGSAAAVEAVARILDERCPGVPLVVDPVLRATTGVSFAADDVLAAYRDTLLPRATIATPNGDELARLRPFTVPVVRTGSESGCDVLFRPGQPPVALRHRQVETTNDHGTGCTFSAAVAAHLAHGSGVVDAVRLAASFTLTQLHRATTWQLGRGRGPIAHTTSEGITK
jgi:hydroxymethylpyrimidine/phosphomethylpyrimidine kinase